MILEIPITTPDGVFYYSVTIILFMILIGIIYRYSEKTSKLLEEMVKNDVRQDGRLDHHDEAIKELKAAIK